MALVLITNKKKQFKRPNITDSNMFICPQGNLNEGYYLRNSGNDIKVLIEGKSYRYYK